jgi:multisubunit Na+/H+ antiporter MnhE subunit
LNVFSYLGVPGTFGYLVAYVLIAISAPIYLARQRAFSVPTLVVSVLVTIAVGYVFYKNLVPVPPSPYDILPYIFFAWAAIGIVWYLVLRVTNPDRAARLGSLQEVADLESVIALELSDDQAG